MRIERIARGSHTEGFPKSGHTFEINFDFAISHMYMHGTMEYVYKDTCISLNQSTKHGPHYLHRESLI